MQKEEKLYGSEELNLISAYYGKPKSSVFAYLPKLKGIGTPGDS